MILFFFLLFFTSWCCFQQDTLWRESALKRNADLCICHARRQARGRVVTLALAIRIKLQSDCEAERLSLQNTRDFQRHSANIDPSSSSYRLCRDVAAILTNWTFKLPIFQQETSTASLVFSTILLWSCRELCLFAFVCLGSPLWEAETQTALAGDGDTFAW